MIKFLSFIKQFIQLLYTNFVENEIENCFQEKQKKINHQ